MKKTKRDIAGYLGIDYKTLFNWEKDRPNLYKRNARVNGR